MTHIQENDLWDFIDQQVAADTQKRIAAHLQECPTCQEVYQTQLRVHRALLELEHESPSTDFSKQVMQKVSKVGSVDRRLQFWLKLTKVTLFSAFGFSILLSLVLLSLQKGEHPPYSPDFLFYGSVLILTAVLSWTFYGLDNLVQRLIGSTPKK